MLYVKVPKAPGFVLATAAQLPAEPVGTEEMTLDTASIQLGVVQWILP